MIVILNGVIIDPKLLEGEDGVTVTITIEDEETGSQAKKVSGELTFHGAAYDVLKAQLIDPIDGRLREVPIELLEDCCTPPKSVLTGVIRGSEVSWCDEQCYCEASIIEKSPTSEAMDCIKSTLLSDNRNGFREQSHPRMVYCDELRPDWMHHVLMCVSVIIMLILYILTPIVAVFNAIVEALNFVIDAVNVLPGVNIDNIDFDGDDATNTIQEWNNFRDRLLLSLVGCGRVHPSPKVRDYIQNVCTICGLSFQSSILNNPSSDYYNTVLFFAPMKKGTRDPLTTYIAENAPEKTLDVFLSELAGVFNGGRRIIGTTLHFERIDELPGSGVWVNPATLRADGRMVEGVCYSWSDSEAEAYIKMGMTPDPVDPVGNEAWALYSKVVEWNVPYNSVQRGEKTVQLPYGPLRCRRDNVGGDVLDDYRVLGLASIINAHGEVIMLERGICALPKLLVWDGIDANFGKVKKFNIPGYVKNASENYNYPYHITDHGVSPNTAYASNEPDMALYGRFHAVRNPKVFNERHIDFEFTFEYDCGYMDALNPFASVPTPFGAGRITSITINLSERTILVAGKL